jgi:NHL repeat
MLRFIAAIACCAGIAACSRTAGSPAIPLRSQPDAASGSLIYLSSDLYAVDVYTYPKLEFVGTLQGPRGPEGLCADQNGDVWVTDYGRVLEYAAGSLGPIAILADTGQDARACAVDPATGDLAVANYAGPNGGPGSVAVYKGARGQPILYSDPNLERLNALSYGANDVLYVDGTPSSSGSFQLSALSAGKFTDFTLRGATITFPGGVQYAGGKLAIGDQLGAVVYRVKLGRRVATVTGSTTLPGASQVYQFFIYGEKIFTPDDDWNDVRVYSYPKNRPLIKQIFRGSGPVSVVITN